MTKILLIDECKECPHFNFEPIQHSDNEYKAICCHPNFNSPIEWNQRIGNMVIPPRFCPLSDYHETNEYENS